MIDWLTIEFGTRGKPKKHLIIIHVITLETKQNTRERAKGIG